MKRDKKKLLIIFVILIVAILSFASLWKYRSRPSVTYGSGAPTPCGSFALSQADNSTQVFVVFQYKLSASQKDIDGILRQVGGHADYHNKNTVGMLVTGRILADQKVSQLYKNSLVTSADVESACYPD